MTGACFHVWRDDLAGQTLRAVCEVAFYPLEDGQDEPQIPEYAHAALADYICYRHLSSGNLAKQSRAQFYQNSFYQAMQRHSAGRHGKRDAVAATCMKRRT